MGVRIRTPIIIVRHSIAASLCLSWCKTMVTKVCPMAENLHELSPIKPLSSKKSLLVRHHNRNFVNFVNRNRVT